MAAVDAVTSGMKQGVGTPIGGGRLVLVLSRYLILVLILIGCLVLV